MNETSRLELYALGVLSPTEMQKVEEKLAEFPSLRKDLLEIEKTLENYAQLHKFKVNPSVKSFLIAKIGYLNRLKSDVFKGRPPSLSKDSKIDDFKLWLDDADFQEPSFYDEMAGHILDVSNEKTTFIAWLKNGVPPETHTQEIEKFLIVEGTCNVTIGGKKHVLNPGNYIEILPNIEHHIQVTSDIRCKVILELTAA